MAFDKNKKTTFALFFGNRGFFPADLMDAAREELPRVLNEMGYDYIMMDRDATRNGAVETPEEGQKYAKWLKEHEGEFQGVILSLPNFGDENGAVAALKHCGAPILIQAYPDEMDRMAPSLRRDSFCGKFSIMDVFFQHGVKYTALQPHTAHPLSDDFKDNLRVFDGVCRVAAGLQGMVVGAIGARTTAFKTVRIDEVALERNGITMETLDLSDVFVRMEKVGQNGAYQDKKKVLEEAASWQGVPEDAKDKLIRAGVVIDELIDEYAMDACAIRCWLEFQQHLGVSPCILLSEMNNRNVVAACEVDVGNAVTMHALNLASYQPSTCLDWNNNFKDAKDKCILFHCGPVPSGLMAGKGRISDHAILANAVGEGQSYGCNVGRIAPFEFTFGSMGTFEGRPRFFLGTGEFTEDAIPEDYFGCAGVARIDKLQDVLLHVGKHGFRHHVSATKGNVAEAVHEALTNYLGMDVTRPQET
jgi:L-fucose isomerase-like protein